MSVYDNFDSSEGRDGAMVHHYFTPGLEFWFRWEGPEWLVVAGTPNPHTDEWRTIEIDQWEEEFGGEVTWDDLRVYAKGALRDKRAAFESYAHSKADPYDVAHGEDR